MGEESHAEYHASDGTLRAPNFSFKVQGIMMEPGLRVEAGDPIIALLGSQYITAPVSGKITAVHIQPDQVMAHNDLIATIEADAAVAMPVGA